MKVSIIHGIPLKAAIMTCIGVFAGIGGLALLAYLTDLPWIMAPFGSSAVLIYYATNSPLAKPKNLICSHIIAALVAITCVNLMGVIWYCMALSVMITILLLAMTDTVHPPAGATALFIALEGIDYYSFVLMPVTTGVLILFLTAWLSSK
ncbi:MAG: HPP family protein, partial [Firmicutes bacterium]|nr:HPP family protein [Bacillota bacterium]